MSSIYINADNVLELKTLTDKVTNTVVTDAAVDATLTDISGNVVSGQTFPVTMNHISGGTYRAVLEETLTLVEGRKYYADITATKGSVVGHWRLVLKATYNR